MKDIKACLLNVKGLG